MAKPAVIPVAALRVPRRTRRIARGLIGLVVSALLAAPAAAQQSGSGDSISVSAQLLDNCRLAAQAIATGPGARQYGWAVRMISSCDPDGPASAASVWRRLPPDTVDLINLVGASTLVLDARTFDAVMIVAQDRASSTFARLSALRVLGSYASPDMAVSYENLTTADSTRAPMMGPVRGHRWRMGAQPVPGSAPGRVQEVLYALAQDDPDRTIASAARWLAGALVRAR